jgi:hypothetical protein
LVLSACSGGSGSSSAIPGGATAMGHHVAQMHLTAVSPDRKSKNPCPSSKYYFCTDVSPSSSGPYVQWAACTSSSSCPPTYDLVASNTFYNKPGTKVIKAKNLSSTWYPSPGNPTYEYITDSHYGSSNGKVKVLGETSACYYYYPSVCSSTFPYGVIFT